MNKFQVLYLERQIEAVMFGFYLLDRMDWVGDRIGCASIILIYRHRRRALFDRLGNNMFIHLVLLELLFGQTSMCIDYGTDTGWHYPPHRIVMPTIWLYLVAISRLFLHSLSLSLCLLHPNNLPSIRFGSFANECKHPNKNGMGRRYNLDERYEISIRCKCLRFLFCKLILPAIPIRILGSLRVPYMWLCRWCSFFSLSLFSHLSCLFYS